MLLRLLHRCCLRLLLMLLYRDIRIIALKLDQFRVDPRVIVRIAADPCTLDRAVLALNNPNIIGGSLGLGGSLMVKHTAPSLVGFRKRARVIR